MRRIWLFGLGIVAAAAAALWLRGGVDSPEEQVRALLRELIEAAEARDLGGILDHVSRDFRGQGMDRDQLKGLLFVELRRGAWRRVILFDTAVTVADDQQHARVDTQAVLAAGEKVESVADLLPTSGDRYRFVIELRREADEAWRAIGATYAPVRQGGIVR